MKNLAIDLDSGKLSRWIDDPREFPTWEDKYADIYTLRVTVYRSGGGRVPDTSLKLLVKRPRRRDVKPLWSLTTFTRIPSFNTPSVATYVGQVSVTGAPYRDALKLDAASGNDLASASFLAVIQVTTASSLTEVEFDYTLLNSAYRPSDTGLSTIYVGVSDTNGLLIRNADGPQWRELVVSGTGASASFMLGTPVLGPVTELSTLSASYVRVSNGVLQIKNDDTSSWVNVLIRGSGGSTIALGETAPVGFTLSNNRYKVNQDGRLLIRNIDTGNWHEARVTGSSDNQLALGAETYDS
jgi:hypothetical protein